MFNHIEKIDTVNAGGNCLIDAVYLKSGKVLSISDECAILAPSVKAFDSAWSINESDQCDDDPFAYPTLDLTRHFNFDDLELSEVPQNQRVANFIISAWSEYPDCDLLLLDDGRILCVDSSCVCLYLNYAQFSELDANGNFNNEDRVIDCIA